MFVNAHDQSLSLCLAVILTILFSGLYFYDSAALADDNQVSSEAFVINASESESILLEQNRHITITATGEDSENDVSEASVKVMAMPDIVILSVDFSLKKGESRAWRVSPEKSPYNLRVSGKSGQIRFKVEQNP